MWPFKKRDCAADGHRWSVERRKGYSQDGTAPGGHFRCVADYVEQDRDVCRDCGEAGRAWRTTYSYCIQSLGLSLESRKKLDQEGFVRA